MFLLLCRTGEAPLSFICACAKPGEVVVDGFQGMLERLLQPSDSEEGTSEPDPDLPSKPPELDAGLKFSSGVRSQHACMVGVSRSMFTT